MNRHPLEEAFNATAWEILTAIEHGFRAQVDVKGKLAEYFLNRELLLLQERGVIGSLVWQDKDGEPDFVVDAGGRRLTIECENVRSGRLPQKADACRVEIQKTRNSKDGTPTRGYRADEFDVLAACLFNQTGDWRFLSIATRHLTRRPQLPDFLTVMQRVPLSPEGFWRASLEQAIGDALTGGP